ncbi:hypothetical protein OVS_01595 [Mycoplasma ovis str. Michigan]|uniref:Transposase n=1 Tax=Mycoplasma ovis str. Michigan TaxID=1415773 RepID=A0ABN4BLN5_9MOLU|nr:hypothetical protein OVS_01595 [Mycoplasma ovis str. Michigan]
MHSKANSKNRSILVINNLFFNSTKKWSFRKINYWKRTSRDYYGFVIWKTKGRIWYYLTIYYQSLNFYLKILKLPFKNRTILGS